MLMGMQNLSYDYSSLSRKYKDFINISPIQTGAVLPDESKKALDEFAIGYAPYNLAQGIEIMDIEIVKEFIYKDLPGFLGSDIARITFGARDGIYTAMRLAAKPHDTVLVDENRHYTTVLAAEKAGLNIIEAKSTGYPDYTIDADEYISLMEKHKPSLAILTYPDGNYGNLPDAKTIGEAAKENNVPFLLNCAYSIGRMPISLKRLNADFVIGSGHKSMASIGPVGVIGASEKWSEKMLKKSKYYEKNELEFLGSEIRGSSFITLMASFPYLVRRINEWDKEVAKARWFSKSLEMLGLLQLGEKPHRHDLMKFKTDIFYEISKIHPKKRTFLYEELKKNRITGIQQGRTKNIKLSTYGIEKESLKKVIEAFEKIVDTY